VLINLVLVFEQDFEGRKTRCEWTVRVDAGEMLSIK
jgi:hypothetical protein